MTMTPKRLRACPEDMTHIADGLPYRDFVTVGLLVKHHAT